MKQATFDKNKIISYIVDKQVGDGGFFFAQVEPSSGYDTYCATKTLKILNSEPLNKSAIFTYWKNEYVERELEDINGIFFAEQSIRELLPSHKLLKDLKDSFKSRKDIFLERLLHKKSFNLSDNVTLGNTHESVITTYTEVVEGELQNLYYFALLCVDFKLEHQSTIIKDFLKSMQNEDGGYGNVKGSQISTSYYALSIYNLLSLDPPNISKTKLFIENRSNKIQYLEDLFWLSESQRLLHMNIFESNNISSFLYDCWNDNGGFRRSRDIGVSNLEWTYFAVTLLKRYKLL